MYNFPVSYLNSNDGSSILAFGHGDHIEIYGDNAIEQIQQFIDNHSGLYIFSALGYDLKNSIEKLSSCNEDNIEFPLAILWVPAYVVKLNGENCTYVQGIESNDSNNYVDYFLQKQSCYSNERLTEKFLERTSREAYLRNVIQLKNEIQLGNIYEVNYCQEFYAENVEMNDSLSAYFKLNEITKAPFSSFFDFENFTVLCGSPERYIRKKGEHLSSSPIKGTAKRGATIEEDEELKRSLFNDKKERSENVMIVDLVRNDLSKIAKPSSVKVDELFGVYTFATVHQLISTVSCTLRNNVSFSDILNATFPMGSMTGAPKIRAMQLIEKHEAFKRGIYSGSIGYIDPSGDFDFNVIIRTLIYNKKKKYLSCPVGGAITINSDPEKEYEECLIKVKGILDKMNA